MACNRCGTPCKGGLCHDCELERRYGDDATVDTSTSNAGKQLEYRCTNCGTEYKAEEIGCPECEAHRARYIGELEAGA